MKQVIARLVEIAANPEFIPMRTLVTKAGGTAALRKMSHSKAAIALKNAAKALQAERKAKGLGWKLDKTKAQEWLDTNTPKRAPANKPAPAKKAAKPAKKDSKAKTPAKKVERQSRSKDYMGPAEQERKTNLRRRAAAERTGGGARSDSLENIRRKEREQDSIRRGSGARGASKPQPVDDKPAKRLSRSKDYAGPAEQTRRDSIRRQWERENSIGTPTSSRSSRKRR